MQHWREFSELIIRFRAIYDLIVISGASNLLPCCVFMLLLLSVMLKKKRKNIQNSNNELAGDVLNSFQH